MASQNHCTTSSTSDQLAEIHALHQARFERYEQSRNRTGKYGRILLSWVKSRSKIRRVATNATPSEIAAVTVGLTRWIRRMYPMREWQRAHSALPPLESRMWVPFASDRIVPVDMNTPIIMTDVQDLPESVHLRIRRFREGLQRKWKKRYLENRQRLVFDRGHIGEFIVVGAIDQNGEGAGQSVVILPGWAYR
jgi:hypothetical protein